MNLTEIIHKLAFLGKTSDLGELLLKLRLEGVGSAVNFDAADDCGETALVHCVRGAHEIGVSEQDRYRTCLNFLADHGAKTNRQDAQGRTPLHWAVGCNLPGLVSELLTLGADPTVEDEDGRAAMHFGIQAAATESMDVLITVDWPTKLIELPNQFGVPPLVYAIQQGFKDVCRYLLERGADVDVLEDKNDRRTPLHHAIYEGRHDIFSLLLEYGAHGDIPDGHHKCVIHKAACVEELAFLYTLCLKPGSMSSLLVPNEEGATALMLACQREYLDHVKTLLAVEPCLTVTDNSGKTPLHYCVENETGRVAELLLRTDKSVIDTKDSEGYSALQLAVIACNIQIVTLLLKHGADINQTDSEGHTVVHWATVCGHVVLIDLLGSYGADMSHPDSHNAVPLHYAAQMCAISGKDSDSRLGLLMLHKLLSKKVKVDYADQDERTPLLWAASSGSRQACEVLMKAGAKKEAADKDGLRALHCAASRGNVKCVELLVKQRVDVNSADKNGCTSLFYAVSLGHIRCVKVLLSAKANASHRDKRNRSAAHGASALGSIEMLKLLSAHKGQLWLNSSGGESPIHEAALAKHNDVVQYLLECHPRPTELVNSTNERGRTCLHIAALTNNLPLCQLLLSRSAKLNPIMDSKEDKRQTPYDAALVKGHTECAEYLRANGGERAMDTSRETDDRILESSDKDVAKDKDERLSNGSENEESEGETNTESESDAQERDNESSKADGTANKSVADEKGENGDTRTDKADEKLTSRTENGGYDKKHSGDTDKEATADKNDIVNSDTAQGAANSRSESPDKINTKQGESGEVSDDTDDECDSSEDEETEAEETEAESPAKSDTNKTNSVQVEKGEDDDVARNAIEERLSEEAGSKEHLDSSLRKELAVDKDGADGKRTEDKPVVSDEKSGSNAGSERSGNSKEQNHADDEREKSKEEVIDKEEKTHEPQRNSDDGHEVTPQKLDEPTSNESPTVASKSNKTDNSEEGSFWSPAHKTSEEDGDKRKGVAGVPLDEKQNADAEDAKQEEVPEESKKIETEPVVSNGHSGEESDQGRDSGMENSTDGEHTYGDTRQGDSPENQSEPWAKMSERSPSTGEQSSVARNPRKPQRPKTVSVTERKHLNSRPQPIKSTFQSPERRRKSQEVWDKEREHRQAYGINRTRPLFDNNLYITTRPKTSAGLRRCRNEIQESVRIFEVKKLVIQQIQKTRKIRMFNTYRQMMSEKAMVRVLLRDYNQLSRRKQDEQDFGTVGEWEMFLLDELSHANRAEKENKIKSSDNATGRRTNAPAAAPTTAPTSSQSESSITDGSSRQPSPERRVRSPSREDKRRKLREEQQERQLKTTYSQQSIPLGRSTEEPRSHPRSVPPRGKPAGSSQTSSTTDSLPKIHSRSTRQPPQMSRSYTLRPVTKPGQRRNQTASHERSGVDRRGMKVHFLSTLMDLDEDRRQGKSTSHKRNGRSSQRQMSYDFRDSGSDSLPP